MELEKFLEEVAQEANVDLESLNLSEELTTNDLYKISTKLEIPVNALVLFQNEKHIPLSNNFVNGLIESNDLEMIKFMINNTMLIAVGDKLYLIPSRMYRSKVLELSYEIFEKLIVYLLNNDLVHLAFQISNKDLCLKIESLDRSDVPFDKLVEYMFYMDRSSDFFPEYLEKIYDEIDENGKLLIEEKVVELFKNIKKVILDLEERGIKYTLTKYNFSYYENESDEFLSVFYSFDMFYLRFSEKNREIIENIIFEYGIQINVTRIYRY